MPLKGIDVSSHQSSPDFSLLKGEVDFVICKASEGVGFTDPQFHFSQSNLRINNILRGFYHFARPDLGNSAQAEAEYFLQTIGELQAGELLFLDYEINYADPVNWCKAFLDEVHTKTGVKPLIYLNLSLVRGHDWSSIINAGYGLWLADYDGVSDNTPDTPWPVVAMKQWTSSGSLNGISGNVDLNSFFGDSQAWQAYGYTSPLPNPPSSSGAWPTFTDQTKIPFNLLSSADFPLTEDMEVQALRGKLGDLGKAQKQLDGLNQELNAQANVMAGLQAKITDLNNQLLGLKAINATQAQMIADLQKQLPSPTPPVSQSLWGWLKKVLGI